MKVVWKYPLEPYGEWFTYAKRSGVKTLATFEIPLPKDAVVLHVAAQGNTPCLWALVLDPEAKKIVRRFIVVGTGHGFETDGAWHYCGTTTVEDVIVLHVFELLDFEPVE